MSPIVTRLRALDRALVANGFPSTSPWWSATLERFYASGKRQLVLRCGRRGGKSSTLCRVGVAEALYGEGSKSRRDTLFNAAAERLSLANPADDEARVLHALGLLGLNQGVRDFTTYMQAGALAEDVLRRNPDHPAAANCDDSGCPAAPDWRYAYNHRRMREIVNTRPVTIQDVLVLVAGGLAY